MKYGNTWKLKCLPQGAISVDYQAFNCLKIKTNEISMKAITTYACEVVNMEKKIGLPLDKEQAMGNRISLVDYTNSSLLDS